MKKNLFKEQIQDENTMTKFAQAIFRRFISSASVLKEKSASKNDILKTIDVATHFKKPELLKTLAGYKLIHKDELSQMKKGYTIHHQNRYLFSDGNVTQFVKKNQNDKKLPGFIIRKTRYTAKNDFDKKFVVFSIECQKNSLHEEAFDTHVIIREYYDKEQKQCKNIPDVKLDCIRFVDELVDLKRSLGDFAKYAITKNIHVKKCDKSEKYIKTRKKDGTSMVRYNHYTHLSDSNIKAVLITVHNNSKLENLGLLQVYSAKKQTLIRIKPILEKMKSRDYDKDFSVKLLSQIENDQTLKQTYTSRKVAYKKTSDETFMNATLKEGDIVYQKFQFESIDVPDVIYFVCLIVKPEDSVLKPLEGQALVQRVETKHQIITEPDGVINFMLSWVPMIDYKKRQILQQQK